MEMELVKNGRVCCGVDSLPCLPLLANGKCKWETETV